MKKPLVWIAFLAALVIIGCGGGGGGDSTTSTDGSTGFTFGLSLSPTSVPGGQSAQGTINLSSAAPVGGLTLALSSSNSAIASVPGSVTVPEGQTSRTFNIATSSVAATSSVTIRATLGPNQDSQTLEVRRVSITTGVIGTVRSTNGDPLSGAVVRFYQENGTFIKEVTTSAIGSFEASLPTTARRFTVDISGTGAAGTYFNQFSYDNEEYIANNTSCLAPLPAFANGEVKSLNSAVVFMPRSMGPPPPPTGCLG